MQKSGHTGQRSWFSLDHHTPRASPKMPPPTPSAFLLSAFLPSACLLFQLLQLLQPTQSQVTPYVGRVHPAVGSDEGGYIVTISGRNLGFLDIDCAVKFGSQMGKHVKVTDSWDKLEVEVPPCTRCGKVSVIVTCDGGSSNAVPFVMTNNCYGPLLSGGSGRPDLPTPFSARENCTVCMDLVQLTMSAASDQTSYQGLQSAIQQSCYTNHFKKWAMPGTKCKVNLSPACRLMLGTEGDLLLDTMWNLWDDHYWNGGLPFQVCSTIERCTHDAVFGL